MGFATAFWMVTRQATRVSFQGEKVLNEGALDSPIRPASQAQEVQTSAAECLTSPMRLWRALDKRSTVLFQEPSSRAFRFSAFFAVSASKRD